MAVEIRVPRLGWTMETGSFAGWLRKDGETVEEGTPLFSVEGDKAIQEVEAMGTGILRIRPDGPAAGAAVEVGALLGYVVAPGETAPFEPERPRATSAPESRERPSADRNPIGRAGRRPAASPRARRVARDLGVDWTELRGSGRTGRIVERDVRGAVATVSSPRRIVPWTQIRKAIAERMHEGSTLAAPVRPIVRSSSATTSSTTACTPSAPSSASP